MKFCFVLEERKREQLGSGGMRTPRSFASSNCRFKS